jgi:mannose-6-phosphate isomerase-like protein (cupin superfamily)
MIIRDIEKADYINASDNTKLCELIHPLKENFFEISYSLAHLILEPSEKSQPHKLINSSELYYILEGNGIIHVDSETAKIKSGQAIYVPPNSVQFIENCGKVDLKFLCIVSPPWRSSDDITA